MSFIVSTVWGPDLEEPSTILSFLVSKYKNLHTSLLYTKMLAFSPLSSARSNNLGSKPIPAHGSLLVNLVNYWRVCIQNAVTRSIRRYSEFFKR